MMKRACARDPEEFFLKLLQLAMVVWLAACTSLFATPSNDPELENLLSRMQANTEKAYHTRINGYVSLVQAGHKVKVGMRGRLIFQDSRHSRLKITMEMQVFDNPAKMDLLVVSDGEFVWQEIRSSLMPAPEVERTKLGSNDASSQWIELTDWRQQLQEIKELNSLAIVKHTEDTITLEGVLDEVSIQQLGLDYVSQEEKDAMIYRIVIDKKTAFPRSILKGNSERPAMELHFENFGFLNPSDIPPGAFGYQPPDDALQVP